MLLHVTLEDGWEKCLSPFITRDLDPATDILLTGADLPTGILEPE